MLHPRFQGQLVKIGNIAVHFKHIRPWLSRYNIFYEHNFFLNQTVKQRPVNHRGHRKCIMPGRNNRQVKAVSERLNFTACAEAPGNKHARSLLQCQGMRILPVPDNEQTACIDIPGHRIDLHRSDHIFMQRLVQSFSPAQHVAFHNFYDIAKRQLIRNVTRLLLYPHRTDPLFRNNDPEIFRFLYRTISCSLTDPHAFCQLANGNFRADFQSFDIL
ncbi:hypothetical protein D3C77_478090 [compost metagenome]